MATSKHTTIFFQGLVKMAGVRCVVGIAFCPAGFHTEPVSCSVYLTRLPHTRARALPSGIQNSATTCVKSVGNSSSETLLELVTS